MHVEDDPDNILFSIFDRDADKDIDIYDHLLIYFEKCIEMREYHMSIVDDRTPVNKQEIQKMREEYGISFLESIRNCLLFKKKVLSPRIVLHSFNKTYKDLCDYDCCGGFYVLTFKMAIEQQDVLEIISYCSVYIDKALNAKRKYIRIADINILDKNRFQDIFYFNKEAYNESLLCDSFSHGLKI